MLRPRAILGDLGLACLVNPGEGSTYAGNTGRSGCGHVAYRSPESLRGYAYGPASDMFSLGVLLTEVATGELAPDRSARAFPGPDAAFPSSSSSSSSATAAAASAASAAKKKKKKKRGPVQPVAFMPAAAKEEMLAEAGKTSSFLGYIARVLLDEDPSQRFPARKVLSHARDAAKIVVAAAEAAAEKTDEAEAAALVRAAGKRRGYGGEERAGERRDSYDDGMWHAGTTEWCGGDGGGGSGGGGGGGGGGRRPPPPPTPEQAAAALRALIRTDAVDRLLEGAGGGVEGAGGGDDDTDEDVEYDHPGDFIHVDARGLAI